MNRKRFFFVALMFFTGCLWNDALETSAVSQVNVFHLSRVLPGMTQREVLRVMRYPYDYKVFEINEDVYDVWFYVTRPSALGQTRMVTMNLTPITFKNGILIGWGYSYYNYLVKWQKSEEKALLQPSESSEMQEAIDYLEESPVSMSSRSQKEPAPSQIKQVDQEKEEQEIISDSPLDEEDEEMLEKASEQQFDQS